MTNNNKEPFFSKGYIFSNLVAIFLMIAPLYMPHIPHWIAGIIFWVSIAALLIISIHHIITHYRLSFRFVPFGKIPLHEAAQIAYNELRKYPIGTISKKMYPKDNSARYLANHIAESIELWGKPKYVNTLEIINKENMGHIRDNTITNNGGDVLYSDLMVERKHFKAYLEEAKKLA